jgi:hypothetical protein
MTPPATATHLDADMGSSLDASLLEHRFSEQGVQVYELNDMEWWAGREKSVVIAAALEAGGMTEAEAFDAHNPVEDVSEVDLDKNKVNINEDCLPEGPIISYREQIKRMIANGESFPCFFAGEDR